VQIYALIFNGKKIKLKIIQLFLLLPFRSRQ